jgi:hypothetical protein
VRPTQAKRPYVRAGTGAQRVGATTVPLPRRLLGRLPRALQQLTSDRLDACLGPGCLTPALAVDRCCSAASVSPLSKLDNYSMLEISVERKTLYKKVIFTLMMLNF